MPRAKKLETDLVETPAEVEKPELPVHKIGGKSVKTIEHLANGFWKIIDVENTTYVIPQLEYDQYSLGLK